MASIPAGPLITADTFCGGEVGPASSFSKSFLTLFVFDLPKKFVAFVLPGAYNTRLLLTSWNDTENALFAVKAGRTRQARQQVLKGCFHGKT